MLQEGGATGPHGGDGGERLPYPPLLIITDRQQARAPLEDILGAAFAAGCRWASIREKDLGSRDQIALAARLKPIARRWRARLTLHGDPALAYATGLDGVHLPAGTDPSMARALLREDALIGISLHAPADAEALIADVVDYAILGPAYVTTSKPGYGPALGRDGIAAIVRATRVPIVAIGGITAATTGEIQAAGAAGIAVMGGVMRAEDPAQEVKSLLTALSTSAANSTFPSARGLPD